MKSQEDFLFDYATQHSAAVPELLLELERETHQKILQPRMLSGPLQGRFLSLLAQLLQPQCIVEIGTFTGYSAMAFAPGLKENGKIITIDINEELEDLINGFFKKSGYTKKIDLRIGNALDIIPTLNEKFDLVFIDADKEQYVDYYELAITKVKPGGYLLADNVLWGGKVLEDDIKSDKETAGIKNFNQHIKDDDRVEQVMLSIRDGLLLIRKL